MVIYLVAVGAAPWTTVEAPIEQSGQLNVLLVFALAVLAFIYIPLGVVTINSFNSNAIGSSPPGVTTLEWWCVALSA